MLDVFDRVLSELWTREPKPAPRSELPHLTAPEHAVYRGLLEHRWGECVRLQQERIAWDAALATTQRALARIDMAARDDG